MSNGGQNQGWIKLHRQLWDNPRAKDPEWLSVWLYLLSFATHQPWRVLWDGELIELKPGQLITGRHAISEETGVHPSKVQRILNTLKTDQQIDQQAGRKSSIVTVLNWGMYQKTDQQTDQQAISSRSATDQQAITNKNPKNPKNKRTNSKPGGVEPEAGDWKMAKMRVSDVLVELGYTEPTLEAEVGVWAKRYIQNEHDAIGALKDTKVAMDAGKVIGNPAAYATELWKENVERREDWNKARMASGAQNRTPQPLPIAAPAPIEPTSIPRALEEFTLEELKAEQGLIKAEIDLVRATCVHGKADGATLQIHPEAKTTLEALLKRSRAVRDLIANFDEEAA